MELHQKRIDIKMRKILFILTLLVYGLAFSQQSENRFQQSEEIDATGDANYNSSQNRGPGGPPGDDDPEPVPIDNYIPVLLLGAIGITVYAYRKKITITK